MKSNQVQFFFPHYVASFCIFSCIIQTHQQYIGHDSPVQRNQYFTQSEKYLKYVKFTCNSPLILWRRKHVEATFWCHACCGDFGIQVRNQVSFVYLLYRVYRVTVFNTLAHRRFSKISINTFTGCSCVLLSTGCRYDRVKTTLCLHAEWTKTKIKCGARQRTFIFRLIKGKHWNVPFHRKPVIPVKQLMYVHSGVGFPNEYRH